jgi:FkbM family methyltransferase
MNVTRASARKKRLALSLSEDDIRLCYRIVLGREADPSGLKHLLAFTKARNISDPHAIARMMFKSPEFFRRCGASLTQPKDIFIDTKQIKYQGVMFTLPAKDFSYLDLEKTGGYEPYLTDHLFALLRPGMTLLDVGANLGLISLPAARLVGNDGQVIAFEASGRNAALLMRNAITNQIRNIDIYPVGLSDRNGAAVSRRQPYTSNQRLFHEQELTEGSELIPTVTLDGFLPPGTKVDVAKIDVEGLEYRVLQGAQKLLADQHPHLYLEYSDIFQRSGSGVPGDDLLRLVLRFGYKPTVLHRSSAPQSVTGSESDMITSINKIWKTVVEAGGTHLDLYFAPSTRKAELKETKPENTVKHRTYETFFRDLFVQTDQPSGRSKEAIRKSARIHAAAIAKSQQDYQPFYGLGDEHESSARRSNLLLSVDLIRQHYANIKIKNKIRVLDVGCNAGFVSFSLAETFPLTRGLDISEKHLALCHDLAELNESAAKFSKNNILDILSTGDADLENVDCVLLLNVVHQLIFAQGIPYVRSFLARLAERVDVIILELARKEEYKKFNQDHLLPEDPTSILSSIRGCTIQLVRNVGRPLFKITRNQATFGRLSAPAERVIFSKSLVVHENRKYYAGAGRFLKVFRFTPDQTPASYYREVKALQALSDSSLVPQIFDWTVTKTYGAVLMEQLAGAALNPSLRQFANSDSLTGFLKVYVTLAAMLGKRGLYHNDLSAHNITVLPAGGVRFIDFEQADTRPYTDPFSVMLWTICDILSGDLVSYKQNVYRRLYVKTGGERVSSDHYPDLSTFTVSDQIKELIADATTHSSWFQFANEWSVKLAK